MTSTPTNAAGGRLLAGPFNRVEGDLEVSLDVVAGKVAAARVNSPLYRGFEQILHGKAPLDALTLTPRICGICSVAQSAAAARALAAATAVKPPPNGRLAANLTQAVENLCDHLTHFYLFFMPDFAHADYARRSWHDEAVRRFAAVSGGGGVDFLAARAHFLQMLGLLAGKWPHTLALRPGGSSRPLGASEVIRLQRLLAAMRAFVEQHVFAAPLEAVCALDSVAALTRWRGEGGGGDWRRFLDYADDLDLWRLGRSGYLFISHGAYDEEQGHLFAAGVGDGAAPPRPFAAAAVSEDVSHAWYADSGAPLRPSQGGAAPRADRDGGYSWCKAPRYDGAGAETGALARQLIAGQPLLRALTAAHGGGVAARVCARLLETAMLIEAMQRWLDEIRPGDAWCVDTAVANDVDADGIGLVEAARGALGHWLSIRRGRIHNYQIIAPTTWNFSPRDAAGQPGALEQALVGIDIPAGDEMPPRVQHVVRSFDPCMVCTVH